MKFDTGFVKNPGEKQQQVAWFLNILNYSVDYRIQNMHAGNKIGCLLTRDFKVMTIYAGIIA